MGRRFDYEAAVDALSSALVFGINPSLDGIRAITEGLGRPQDSFDCVQVTGTNGKSSVTWFTAALLQTEVLSVGAYTSPELHSYIERIQVDGRPVSEEMFAAAVAAALDIAGSAGVELTEFELLTAAALWAYGELSVDIAVLEVGMGGRWDATTVTEPIVAVVTGVGIDHGEHLGTTQQEIAAEKAEVLIAGSTAVLGPGTVGVEEVLLQRADTVGISRRAVRVVREYGESTPVAEGMTVRYLITAAPDSPDGHTRLDVRGLYAEYPRLEIRSPRYQAANVATSIAAAEAVSEHALNPDRVREALGNSRFPGRFEVVGEDPWVVVDGAHNPQAATELSGAIYDAFGEMYPVAILGVLADKDAEGIVTALAPFVSEFVCVAPDSPRALAAEELADVVERVTSRVPKVADTVAEGVATVRAERASAVVTGSIRTAAEARSALP